MLCVKSGNTRSNRTLSRDTVFKSNHFAEWKLISDHKILQKMSAVK